MKKLPVVLSLLLLSGICFSQNAIVTENQQTAGVTPRTVWDLPKNDDGSYGDATIQGFATDISVQPGGTINFKITVTDGAPYTITIYRLGYYNGNGARQWGQVTGLTGVIQPHPLDGPPVNGSATGLMDYGNWSVTASWSVPANAVSGLYIARLKRTGNGGASHIPFIVRNEANTTDGSNSAILFKTSDATWEAYNGCGGNSLYVAAGTLPNDHASKVSYNRPYTTRDGGGGGVAEEDWLFNAEYPMIRFLERNGYNMTYTTDLDLARSSTNPILSHKIFLSVGHDEYWSKEERNQVEAARAAGVNMAFFSGNEVYWKTRWENSIDASNTPFRTMVCYKEGDAATGAEKACGSKCDPSSNPEWTGLWRYGCDQPDGNACKPENGLSGQISWDNTQGTISVPFAYKNLRIWRNAPGVAALATPGDTLETTDGTLGYEWDWQQSAFQSSYPAGRAGLSYSVNDGRVHKLSLYRYPGGGLVFGAGTVQWSWGLDDDHDRTYLQSNSAVSPDLQQATINILSDMGVQPVTLQTGLVTPVAVSDLTPPSSKITSPTNGSTIPLGNTSTITGSATDPNGGVVAGVDISVDGTTWLPATIDVMMNGTVTWSYSWIPNKTGNVTITSRSYDDYGNVEATTGNEGGQNQVTVVVSAEGPPTDCPCFLFDPNAVDPTEALPQDLGGPVSLGMRFRATFDGQISAIRFFKAPGDEESNTVNLWTVSGTKLAEAVGTKTPGQWDTIKFQSPVEIHKGTIYVASYINASGYYMADDNYFADSIVRGPLVGIQDSAVSLGGNPNGLYSYQSDGNPYPFPRNGYLADNYWVDVIYSPTTGPDITPPAITVVSPANNATGVSVNSFVSVTFNEDIDPATATAATFVLRQGTDIILATVTYTASARTITLIPNSPLLFSTVYTVTAVGGSSGIKDLAGNALVANSTWSFTTAAEPATPPDDGAGGPVLIISSTSNNFSRYPVEILRAQGYNGFVAMDIAEVTPSIIAGYDVVLLGHFSLTGQQITMLTDWVNAGGTLIAFRPDAGLASLLGISPTGNTLKEGYLLVDNTKPAGAGIVNQTIQFHDFADLYTLSSGATPKATQLAALYSDATTATAFPALTTRDVGLNGGKAIAFTYDLPKSIVYTRQGNPQWAGEERDDTIPPIRSDNLFFGNASFDPQPDWINLDKVAIPQADEQQHLLTNVMLLSTLHRKPLPHLWFLPSGFKAAVVMTGDDHAIGNTAPRFDDCVYQGTPTSDPDSVADWKTVRMTSYIYTGTPISNAAVIDYQNKGFEIALHPTTFCVDFTPASLQNNISTQWSQLQAQLPGINALVTNRTHCMPWSDWASHPKVENGLGIRFDVNYYYWPGSWIKNRPGMFTGSGMPMRFADLDGTIIDCYQAPTQMPDESQLDISYNINTLLDNALDVNKGYYGAFVMNMHTDYYPDPDADAIINAAKSRGIPVVSAKQMLTWLDSRNNTSFGGPGSGNTMTWDGSKLSFNINSAARNLQAMVPFNSAGGTLISVTENGAPTGVTTQMIKGINYGVFNVSNTAGVKQYVATYTSTPLPITLVDFTANRQGSNDVLVKWSTSMESNNKGFEVQRSTDAAEWTVIGFVAGAGNSQTLNNYQLLDPGLDPGTYYYRLRQIDFDGKFELSKVAQVTIPGLALELMQNYPNPLTSGNTTIQYSIPKSCQAQIILYDQMGRPIQTLVDEMKAPGTYQVTVNKNGLGSGMYYYRLNALGKSIVKKMTVL